MSKKIAQTTLEGLVNHRLLPECMAENSEKETLPVVQHKILFFGIRYSTFSILSAFIA